MPRPTPPVAALWAHLARKAASIRRRSRPRAARAIAPSTEEPKASAYDNPEAAEDPHGRRGSGPARGPEPRRADRPARPSDDGADARCGLRVSETCGLHLRDVDWTEGTIRLRPEVAKGGKEAVVYTDRETQAWLERWKAERRRHAAGKPHLFVRVRSGPDQGGPLNRRGF